MGKPLYQRSRLFINRETLETALAEKNTQLQAMEKQYKVEKDTVNKLKKENKDTAQELESLELLV